FFFFQAEDGIRDRNVTGVQTCALPISGRVVPAGGVLSRGGGAVRVLAGGRALRLAHGEQWPRWRAGLRLSGETRRRMDPRFDGQIGRASCRERVESGVGGVAG